MKKIFFALSAFVLSMSAVAQTLNVKVGSVSYQFPAEKVAIHRTVL